MVIVVGGEILRMFLLLMEFSFMHQIRAVSSLTKPFLVVLLSLPLPTLLVICWRFWQLVEVLVQHFSLRKKERLGTVTLRVLVTFSFPLLCKWPECSITKASWEPWLVNFILEVDYVGDILGDSSSVKVSLKTHVAVARILDFASMAMWQILWKEIMASGSRRIGEDAQQSIPHPPVLLTDAPWVPLGPALYIQLHAHPSSLTWKLCPFKKLQLFLAACLIQDWNSVWI